MWTMQERIRSPVQVSGLICREDHPRDQVFDQLGHIKEVMGNIVVDVVGRSTKP